jgi:hypothetical protein
VRTHFFGQFGICHRNFFSSVFLAGAIDHQNDQNDQGVAVAQDPGRDHVHQNLDRHRQARRVNEENAIDHQNDQNERKSLQNRQKNLKGNLSQLKLKFQPDLQLWLHQQRQQAAVAV